jgi:triosephosphate isomerase
MTRRTLIAGNWKMNGSLAALAELDAIGEAVGRASPVEVALAVPFTLIAAAASRAHGVAIGAQDVHMAEKGAHTGCVSAGMVREAGASFTIVGHSERRADHHETDADVRDKALAARAAGLEVILCVGETEAQRDAGEAEAVVRAQITGSLPEGAAGDWLTIAYEPVWAIGTGRVPTLDDIAAIHAVARATLRALIGEEAEAVRILYGGSVTGDNAAAILDVTDVDGALVGGASLTAVKFVPIVEAGATR